MAQSIYNFSANLNDGQEISFQQFEGKVLLVVNTASRCGFTHHYKGLQELYEKYQGRLEVLAFPCNQFGRQESRTNEEIRDFCDTSFGVSFPLFEKVEVNGDKAHPLFVYLKESLPGLMGTQRIKWNFTKFLVDASGQPSKRYAPKASPASIEKDILSLLS